jgi:adenylate cyclase
VVNTASRLQTHCQGGEIHATEPVYQRLKHAYEFQEKGPVLIKGLGRLETFLLVDKK